MSEKCFVWHLRGFLSDSDLRSTCISPGCQTKCPLRIQKAVSGCGAHESLLRIIATFFEDGCTAALLKRKRLEKNRGRHKLEQNKQNFLLWISLIRIAQTGGTKKQIIGNAVKFNEINHRLDWSPWISLLWGIERILQYLICSVHLLDPSEKRQPEQNKNIPGGESEERCLKEAFPAQSTPRRMGTDAVLPGFMLMHHMLSHWGRDSESFGAWNWRRGTSRWWDARNQHKRQFVVVADDSRSIWQRRRCYPYCGAISIPASSLFLDAPNGTIAEKVRAPTFCALTFSEEEDSRPTSWELGKLCGTARWLPIANWPKEVDQNSNVCEVDSC